MKSLRLTLLAAVAALALAQPAKADYPFDHDIHIICSQAGGSGADAIVRFFANKLGEMTKATVIVENKVGALGAIAMKSFTDARPDGYTLYLSAGNSVASNPHMMTNFPVDVMKKVQFVTTIAHFSFMLVVDANSPYQTAPELIEGLKKKPDNGKYGVNATSAQVSSELFKRATGLKTERVSYNDSMTAMNDMKGGQIDWLFLDPLTVGEQVRAGRLRALAVASQSRLASVPDVPSMKDIGINNLDVETWWALMGPTGMPKPVVEKLAGWMNQIVASEDGKNFLMRNGLDPLPGNPEMAQKKFQDDYVKWAEYIKLADIKVQ